MTAPSYTLVTACAKCGVSLPKESVQLDACPTCKAPLVVRQDATVKVAPLPPMFGSVK